MLKNLQIATVWLQNPAGKKVRLRAGDGDAQLSDESSGANPLPLLYTLLYLLPHKNLVRETQTQVSMW